MTVCAKQNDGVPNLSSEVCSELNMTNVFHRLDMLVPFDDISRMQKPLGLRCFRGTPV